MNKPHRNPWNWIGTALFIATLVATQYSYTGAIILGVAFIGWLGYQIGLANGRG